MSAAAQSHVLDVLNEKNVDVSQFGVKSCERGELPLTMGGVLWVCVNISVSKKPKQSPCLWSSDFVKPLSVMDESGWSPLPSLSSQGQLQHSQDEYIENANWSLLCPLIMVMWCNPRCLVTNLSCLLVTPIDAQIGDHGRAQPVCSVSQCGLYCPPGPHTSRDVTRCQPPGSPTYDAPLCTFQLPTFFQMPPSCHVS